MRVVLPESMWALMPIFRIFSRSLIMTVTSVGVGPRRWRVRSAWVSFQLHPKVHRLTIRDPRAKASDDKGGIWRSGLHPAFPIGARPLQGSAER